MAPLVVGCCGECTPDMVFALPLPPSDASTPITAAFSRSRDAAANVSCAWMPGADSEDGAWSCEPRPKTIKRFPEVTRVEMGYEFDGAGAWVARLTGPAGTADFDLQADDEDPGEGWPGSCPCYGDDLTVYDEHFDAVRFAPPEFGQPCTDPSDCPSDMSCGPSQAPMKSCGYPCFGHACFSGWTCESDWCLPSP